MTIVERIKKECKAKHIPISFLEEQTGLSSGAISKWNTSSPSAEKLYNIAKFLNVSMEYLFIGEERNISLSKNEQEWLSLYKELIACDPELIKECRNCIMAIIKSYQIGKETEPPNRKL